MRRLCHRPSHAAGEALRFECAPEPDVSVKKQLHREASQSSQVPVGATMSPRILPAPTMDPSRLPVVSPGDGGITSATVFPKRVTRMGLRVLRTSSKMPRHLALNSEMAPSFMFITHTMVNDYGQSINSRA